MSPEETVEEIWERHHEEHLKFDRIENKKSSRPDIHAFIMLNELCPSDRDIISAARHDKIYLSISSAHIRSLTEENIKDLWRCGVFYDSEFDSLTMFV